KNIPPYQDIPPSHIKQFPKYGGSVVNPVQPGDWVLIKVHQRKDCLQPRWKGPFLVLLTIPTAVKVAEVSVWVHTSHCKKVTVLTEWKASLTCDTSMKIQRVPCE
uniref:Murine leukemia virus integrase C-terminal domain-containing protein n=1 Tax=Crocodylus porosus TaxID=8502 RepID=A0A7M4EZ18_CROPO